MRTKTLLVVAVAGAMLAGGTVATGTNRVPDRLPVGEATRQLDEYEAKLEQQQAALAACMDQRGFDYIPHLPADWVMERAALLDHVAGGTGDVDIDAPPDPNLAILARLTPAEADAYQRAYWGDDTTVGCYETTYQEVFGISPRAELERLLIAADRVDAAVASDPRIKQATASFITCMGNRGFTVTGIDDVFRQADEWRDALQMDADAAGLDLDEVPGYAEYLAFETTAYEAYDTCIGGYHAVEDEVRSAYVERFLHRP